MAAFPSQQPISTPTHATNLRHDLDFSTEQLNGLLDLTKEVKQSRTRYCVRAQRPLRRSPFRKALAPHAHDV